MKIQRYSHNALWLYFFILFAVLESEICAFAQGTLMKQEEIVIAEGEKYMFKISSGGTCKVSQRNIATCSNGTITAKRNGKTEIMIKTPSGEKRVGLRVLPKRGVSLRGDFPVMAWYSLQEDLSRERFIELANAGFNLSFSYATDSVVPHMRRAIKAVRGTGVKLIIPFRGPWVDLKSIMDYFKNEEGLWGWYVIDEPSYDRFEEVKNFVDRIRSIDSTHPFYINLLPTYAPTSLFKNESYEQYVMEYVKLFSPFFLSFDHYPITNKGVRKDFYKNLNIISSIATQNGIPFWAFACSVKYSGGVPAPKPEHLRLEVYSALAFGAQGIEYFTYTTPRPEHGGEHFSYAPIDVGQKKTKTYNYVKEVNTRLRSVEQFFKDAKVSVKGSLGGDIDGIEQYQLKKLPKGIQSISTTNTLLASWLQNMSSSIFVLVNTNIDVASSISIEANEKIRKVSNDGQLVSVSPIEELLPGDMLVYLVESSNNDM